MRTHFARTISLILIALVLFSAPQLWATCGGGGGGGGGGMSAGGPGGSGASAPDQQVYMVPWRALTPQDPPITSGLILYWFPSSQAELAKSSLRTSRQLSLYASQCVAMRVATVQSGPGAKLAADAKLPVAVLTTPDGTSLNKAENKDGFLRVEQVEKMVETEMKRREETVNQQMKDAKSKAKAGDSASAIPLFRSVLAEKCLFPDKAKDAAKELKKLGVNDVGQLFDAPIFDRAKSTEIERTMQRGLKAEIDSKYKLAEQYYLEAHRADPADPTPLRFLGELYRHQTGDWDKARTSFEAILAMPADPLSRAVAQHGLGKMTIHEGNFAQGLALMESSVQTYPLALAYRNLSVYWNSEGNAAKADEYVQKALALDPNDPYNLVFAAAFMAGNGKPDEALRIARENEGLLSASYNLAAVYAQIGERDKALELLKRHFFEYERYQAVRSKEMMEARVDAVFASLKGDPTFVGLTKDADGKLDPSRTMSMQP